jgi:hypothetical protein
MTPRHHGCELPEYGRRWRKSDHDAATKPTATRAAADVISKNTAATTNCFGMAGESYPCRTTSSGVAYVSRLPFLQVTIRTHGFF